MKDYKTVYRDGYYLLEEKRSRFIARVKPVSSEEEAIAFINSIRSENWDASHNCYAYHIDNEGTYQRYSDDGEPSGTAGLPILEVIRKKEMTNVVIVVTRYFGGILLGAGGLVRAYGKAAAGGVAASEEIWIKTCIQAQIHIEYHLSGKLQNILATEGYITRDIAYTHEVCFTILLSECQKEALEEKLNDLTGGNIRIDYTGKIPVKLDANGKLLDAE